MAVVAEVTRGEGPRPSQTIALALAAAAAGAQHKVAEGKSRGGEAGLVKAR